MMFLWDTSKELFISEAELVLYMCYIYRIRKYSILQKYRELISCVPDFDDKRISEFHETPSL